VNPVKLMGFIFSQKLNIIDHSLFTRALIDAV
jgi:hypothetical protein